MIVICLEGCHGVGKTRLVNEFQAAGFKVLDEGFVDMPKYALHPQSLVMESFWLARWFERLLEHARELGEDNHERTIYIADRSPYSAEFYSRTGGHVLGSLIKHQLTELAAEANITVLTVYIKVQMELLWSRIQNRLELEPHRRQYNEHSREWMDEVVSFYESKEWDFVVENNEATPAEVARNIVRSIGERNDSFRAASPMKEPYQTANKDTMSISPMRG